MSDDATDIIVLAVLGGPLLYVALRDRHRNKRDAQQLIDARPVSC